MSFFKMIVTIYLISHGLYFGAFMYCCFAGLFGFGDDSSPAQLPSRANAPERIEGPRQCIHCGHKTT